MKKFLLLALLAFGTAAHGQAPRIDKLEDPTQMSDVLATKAGKKAYYHGTTYNSSIAPTVTSTGTWSGITGIFIPYQMQDGKWRLRITLRGVSASSTAAQTITIVGITFAAFPQPCFGRQEGNDLYAPSVIADTSTNTITERVTSGYGGSRIIGCDVELASKPTWAY